jgi:TDG/mug DNA glycosylase family protein
MVRRPTKEELAAAGGRTLPDVIAPGLRVLFCGINPGMYTAAVGHHFARPGNRFWKALHAGGFTPRVLDPSEEQLLIRYGCGITNVADRPSTAFGHPGAVLGPQEQTIGGARVWVLPNPSGLNARFRPDDFGRLFGELRRAAWEEGG